MITTPPTQVYFSCRSHTAWQWLAHEHRAVRPGAVPIAWGPPYYHTRVWWYYRYYDTYLVTDQEYQDLKARYIALFGGWQVIDLDTTTYNGHKWY